MYFLSFFSGIASVYKKLAPGSEIFNKLHSGSKHEFLAQQSDSVMEVDKGISIDFKQL